MPKSALHGIYEGPKGVFRDSDGKKVAADKVAERLIQIGLAHPDAEERHLAAETYRPADALPVETPPPSKELPVVKRLPVPKSRRPLKR